MTTHFEPRAFRRTRNRILGRASEAAGPLLRLAAFTAARGGRTDPSTWRRGLILGHNHIGDVLYRTCSLPVLRQHLPRCDWSYLTSPGSAPILDDNPALSEILPWSRGEHSWSLDRGAFRRLRAKRFDVALCTNTVIHYPDFFLAAALGIPNRVGFVHKGLSGLINHPVPMDYPSAYPAYFRQIVAHVAGIPPDWSLQPMIHPRPEAVREARRVIETAGLDKDLPMVACFMTSRQPAGSWPPSLLLRILAAARRHCSFQIALCGVASDKAALVSHSAQFDPPAQVIAGDLSLGALGPFIQSCSAILTLDTGPRHIGNAVGVPVLFARNMSQLAVETGAYCDNETDVAPAGDYVANDEILELAAKLDVESIGRMLSETLTEATRASSLSPP